MPNTDFDKVPSLLEKMRSTWKILVSSKSNKAKLDESDLQTIKEAFIAAKHYEDLNDQWHRAYKLFVNKDEQNFNNDKALREAVEIMGIVPNATQKGKKPRFHPRKRREIYEYYTWFEFFLFENEDGCYYDEEGNNYGNKNDYKKNRIIEMVKKYDFASPRVVEEYLRDNLGLKNIPSFKNHNKNPE
jgi:hypothetical protein